GATSYLLFVYKKNYNQTTDSLINQYSVADSSFVVPNLSPNQKYSYKVSIQPSFCNEEMLTLSAMIYVTTTSGLSTIYPVDSLDISIYPTFCDTELFLNDCDSAKYSIFNILGKIQMNGIITAQSLNVAGLHSGTYFIKIDIEQGSVVRKFVKR
ncbi:MAG: T9SS type A sorting domain-containing protein, partial [Paludibacter sp.]